MEYPPCKKHGRPCMVKTGVKEGPSYGKSFYVCSVSKDRCNHCTEALDLKPMYCDLHEKCMIELRARHNSNSHQENRLYYRCGIGRTKKMSWCGHSVLQGPTSMSSKKPLSDVNVNISGNDSDKVMPDRRSTETGAKRLPRASDSDRTALPEDAQPRKSPHSDAEVGQKTSSERQSVASAVEMKKSVSAEGNIPETERHSLQSSQKSSGLTGTSTTGICKTKEQNHQETQKVKADGEFLKKEAGVESRGPKTSATDFATLSLQNRMKHFTLEGNESLLVSPRSGQLKYRSQIGVDDSDSSDSSDESDEYQSAPSKKVIDDSDSDSSDSDSSDSDSDSFQDCVVTGFEPASKQGQQPQKTQDKCADSAVAAKPVVPSTAHSSKAVPAAPKKDISLPDGVTTKPAPKVITFENETQLKAFLQQQGQKGSIKVVKVPDQKNREQRVAVNPKELRAALLRDTHERDKLLRCKQQQLDLLKKVNRKLLPDGGARLERQVKELTEKIDRLSLKINQGQKTIASLPAEESIPTGEVKIKSTVAHTVSGQKITPGTRQTLLTNHVTQLPQQALQQMYAANPQMMTLYGGRMTAARLQEVGSVTTEAIERLHKQLETMPAADQEYDDPKHLRVSLMPHQRQALAWLTWREKQHPCGGILADDMGLGKTLTMISLVLKDKQELPKKHSKANNDEEWTSKERQLQKLQKGLVESNASLVVCPASLIHQWEKEIERRTTPRALSVLVYHGANRERDVHELAKKDVVLTTYNIIGKEVGGPSDGMKKEITDMPVKDNEPGEGSEDASGQPNLQRVAWRRIILDEAHNIKNHKSLTAISVCRLRAGRRWALTGTPLQNDLLDMYSLLRYLRCSPFDELKVWKRQVDNRSANGQKRLNTLVKSLLLRRTKDQTNKEGQKLVALPGRSTFTHELELSKAERKVYERIFQKSKSTLQDYLRRAEDKQHLKDMGVKPGANSNPWAHSEQLGSGPGSAAAGGSGVGGARGGKAGQPGGSQILLMLLRLRQCCSHLSLTKEGLDAEELEKDDGIELDIVQQMRLMAVNDDVTNDVAEEDSAVKTSIFEPKTPSTKIAALLRHIKDIKEASAKGKPQKCVIVSQWTQMLGVVEQHLKVAGYRCATIKGDITPKKRMEIVDAFNTDQTGPEVMLLSLRAGGVGLNLVGGNHLFLIDMHWNPALESQASDRIYRVGQTKDVSIHRFICKDTIEEKILQLQNRKLQMADNVLSGAKASANKLTLQDLKMLFNLDQPVLHRQAGFQPASSFTRT